MLCHLKNKISLKHFFAYFVSLFNIICYARVGLRLSMMFCCSLSQTLCTYKAMFNHFIFLVLNLIIYLLSINLISIYHSSPKYYSWTYHIRVFLKIVPCWTSLWPPIWCLIPFWLLFTNSYNKGPNLGNLA
jgi:hypothetical protein